MILADISNPYYKVIRRLVDDKLILGYPASLTTTSKAPFNVEGIVYGLEAAWAAPSCTMPFQPVPHAQTYQRWIKKGPPLHVHS